MVYGVIFIEPILDKQIYTQEAEHFYRSFIHVFSKCAILVNPLVGISNDCGNKQQLFVFRQ